MSLTQGEDLPQQNAKGPHVTLGGEHLVKDGLWRHPFKGEAGLSANQITGVGLQMPTHKKTFKFNQLWHFVAYLAIIFTLYIIVQFQPQIINPIIIDPLVSIF